jgi:hypothetical protein
MTVSARLPQERRLIRIISSTPWILDVVFNFNNMLFMTVSARLPQERRLIRIISSTPWILNAVFNFNNMLFAK